MAKVTTNPGRRSVADTVGDRMEAIRDAIGGSRRNQISQEALGELVGFDKYKISRIERGAQELSRADAIAIAKVDPEKRGPGWLMFGDDPPDEGQQGAKINGDPKPKPAPTRRQFVEIPVEVETYQRQPKKGKQATKKPGRSAIA